MWRSLSVFLVFSRGLKTKRGLSEETSDFSEFPVILFHPLSLQSEKPTTQHKGSKWTLLQIAIERRTSVGLRNSIGLRHELQTANELCDSLVVQEISFQLTKVDLKPLEYPLGDSKVRIEYKPIRLGGPASADNKKWKDPCPSLSLQITLRGFQAKLTRISCPILMVLRAHRLDDPFVTIQLPLAMGTPAHQTPQPGGPLVL